MKFNLRKMFTSFCAVSLALCMSVPAFAKEAEVEVETEVDNKFFHNNYTLHTISFNELDKETRSITSEDNIDDAVEYVNSLKLSDMGYADLEEACLNELNSYKDDEVILESYTVLVPKTKSKNYYGTYLNSDYYYDYTSVANLRRDVIGEKKSTSNVENWKNWILGGFDLVMCFADLQWSIPYTLVRIATGVSPSYAVHIDYDSHNEYVEQFTDTVTRTIYKEKSNGTLDPCYQDQTSSLRIKMYFCPVGVFASDFIDIGTIYDDTIEAVAMTKNEILKTANAYSNRNSKIIFKVSYHHLTENWGN